jgi:hypothetical protein
MRRAILLVALGVAALALVVGAALATPPKKATTTLIDKQPSNAAVQGKMPYTFFFTRPEMLGNPNNPTGVRYHSDGKLLAKAPNGSGVILWGRGRWNPKSKTADGGGLYTIKDASGAVRARGIWRVTDFSSFEQFRGWWGMGPDFKEKGWQGPPGSASFSGFLTLKVSLKNQGDGTRVAWCLMPAVLERHPHVVNPDGHVSDGVSLTGGKFNFTEFREGEMAGPPYQGVMFYSTDPASDGYVLTSEGTTVRKTAAGSPTASATATPSATATVSPLPTSGGPSLFGTLALAAALALGGSGVVALAVLRQGLS